MKKKYIILLAIIPIIIQAQNLTSKEGLKFGNWSEEWEKMDGIYFEKGTYRIESLDSYDIIDSSKYGYFYEVNYRGATPTVHFHTDQKIGKKIAVKDGKWELFDPNGIHVETSYYTKGINLWWKTYNDKGELIKHHYIDLLKDSSVYLTYKNNILFKKAFYLKGDGNNQIEVFYPHANLRIDDAEHYAHFNLVDQGSETYPIKLTVSEKTIIRDIKSNSGNFEVEKNILPLQILPKDTVIVNVFFKPSSTTWQVLDTISIITDEEGEKSYNIYFQTEVAHVDGSNIDSISSLTLSKSRDKYLLVAPMGTVTEAFFLKKNRIKAAYKIEEGTRLSLSKLSLGVHHVQILSCNVGGQFDLEIVK